jgi:fumarylpyruvate hydrolase
LAPCAPLQPATRIGHPSTGRIALSVNGKVREIAGVGTLRVKIGPPAKG